MDRGFVNFIVFVFSLLEIMLISSKATSFRRLTCPWLSKRMLFAVYCVRLMCIWTDVCIGIVAAIRHVRRFANKCK